MSSDRDFANLAFKVECTQIILSRSTESTWVIHGPGEIWQDNQGVLQYKIFALEGYEELLGHLNRPRTPGSLLTEDDFFTLEATELGGRVWTAGRLFPSRRGGLSSRGIVFGVIERLVYLSPLPGAPTRGFLGLKLKGLLEFPCNSGTQITVEVGGRRIRSSSSLNAAFVSNGQYQLEIYHEDQHTVVNLHSELHSLSEHSALRIQEALQFCLGRPIAILVTTTYSDGMEQTALTSSFMSRGECRLPPPIQFMKIDEGGHVWNLFQIYFSFVSLHSEARWHPISRQVGGALESTAASIDSEVLGLAIATEGVAGDCFPETAGVSEEMNLAIDEALSVVASSQVIHSDLKPRIEGALIAMRQSRNSDRMRAFLARTQLPSALYSAWSRLRHTSAHGGGTGGRDIAELFQLKDDVLFLFYSMILTRIGYSGSRTDYSTPGWPLIEWGTQEQVPISGTGPESA